MDTEFTENQSEDTERIGANAGDPEEPVQAFTLSTLRALRFASVFSVTQSSYPIPFTSPFSK